MNTTVDVERHEEGRELLEDMVSITSVSGEEREAAERLVAFFEEHGREVWLDDVGNVRAPADDTVLLTSHMDTVPGDIPVRIEEDVIHGRGSVDAKGSLCAMADAAVETGVSFAGVVREEADSRGARHLVEHREAPEAVVNGEPSGWDAVTLGYRGFLPGTYVATSESGHTSRPEPNAIQAAMDWWRRVEDAFGADEWTPAFERVTPKPVGIQGGTSEDGLSVEATMEVQLRIPPEMDAGTIREIADGELEDGTVQWREAIPPVMQSPRTAVARAFRVAIRDFGGEPSQLRKTGTSDMNIYAAVWDAPMVTYGPGDSALDHTPEEHLPLASFDRAVTVLERTCDRLTEGE